VYRSADNNYGHIILPSGDKNKFIVLIIGRNAKTIPGHHLLNLNKEN
jgi:hypothetical protein